jgi:hypothetical protein
LIEPKLISIQSAGPNLGRANPFALIDYLLRDHTRFFGEIRQGIGLVEKMWAMLASSGVSMALYGLLLGSTHSVAQSLSSAIKLPLLFLATLLVCAPVLYIINILFGANLRLSQSIALVLAAICLTGVLLLSFAPIILLFILTVPDSYQFFKLLNVLFFTISGGAGVACLSRGLKIVSAGRATSNLWLIFCLWLGIYGFVGSQMAWTLRPFVGFPDASFELFRQFGGNFYTDILASLGEVLGFIIVK